MISQGLLKDTQRKLITDFTTQAASTTGATLDLGQDSVWIQQVEVQVAVTAIDFVTGDESYLFTLLGSSDNFVADTHVIGQFQIDQKMSNWRSTSEGTLSMGFKMSGLNRRYLRLNSTLAGTTPSITLAAFLSGC